MSERFRKPFAMRALKNRTVSLRRAAGSRRNRKHKFVGSFASDYKKEN